MEEGRAAVSLSPLLAAAAGKQPIQFKMSTRAALEMCAGWDRLGCRFMHDPVSLCMNSRGGGEI